MTDEEVLKYARQKICNYIVLQQGVPEDRTFNIDDVYIVSYFNALDIWMVTLTSSLKDNYFYVVRVDVNDCSRDWFYMFETIEIPNSFSLFKNQGTAIAIDKFMTDEEVLEYARQIVYNYVVSHETTEDCTPFSIDNVFINTCVKALDMQRIVLKTYLSYENYYVVEIDASNHENVCFCIFKRIEPPDNSKKIFGRDFLDEETRKYSEKNNKTLYFEYETDARLLYNVDIRDRDESMKAICNTGNPYDTCNIYAVFK